MNKLVVIGRVARDPDVRITTKGTQMITVLVIANEYVNGEEIATFFPFVFFNRGWIAERIAKGDMVVVEARVRQRENKKYSFYGERIVRLVKSKNHSSEDWTAEDEDVPF